MLLRRSVLSSSLSVVALLTLASCSGGAGTTAPDPTAEARPSEQVAAAPAATATPRHGPAAWFFRQVGLLDLREDQRESVSTIQRDLAASMVPRRASVRQAIRGLADAVELGELDGAQATEQREALSAALREAKESFADALNRVHDTLDPDQRAALVQALRQPGTDQPRANGQHEHGLAKLALQFGLSEAQQAKIREAFRDGLDELFPERKARRERWEARMKALGEAFLTDDFDAADFNLAEHADEALGSAVAVAGRLVEASNGVLNAGQRHLVADWIRGKAENF